MRPTALTAESSLSSTDEPALVPGLNWVMPRGFSDRILQESANPSASVWDVLSLPTGDVRGRPYEERRALMLDVVAGLPEGSPIQAVSATEDVEVARGWYETLTGSRVEGVVAKSGRSPYRAGRSSWKKVRHAETIDAEVVGFTGAAGRPRALAVRLPDGRVLRRGLPSDRR